MKSAYFLLERSKGSCARALEKIYAKVHKKDGTCNIVEKKMRISLDKDVKYGAFWGKLVFGEQNVLNLFGG